MTEPAKPAAKPATPDRQVTPAAPPWWKTLRADPPFPARIGIGVAAIALLVLFWWIETRHSLKFPSPDEVFGSYDQHFGREVKRTHTIDAVLERDLEGNVLATLLRVGKGVLIAAIFGVGLGVLASAYRAVGAAVSPMVIFLRSVPMGAMFPLIVLLASGERAKVLFIVLAVVPFVFSDAYKALSAVPQRYVETAQTLGASRFQIISKVLFPLALPDIISSLRFQFGLALGYIMLVEVFDTQKGIGAMLDIGRRNGWVEQNFLLLFVIAVLAFLIDFVLREFQRLAFRYRTDL